MGKKFKKLLGLGLCFASVGTLAACSTPTIANSDNLTILKQEHADFKESNEALKLEIASLNTEVATMKYDLEEYKTSDNAKAEVIAEKEALLAEKENELANKTALLAEREAEIEELRNQLASLSTEYVWVDEADSVVYNVEQYLYDNIFLHEIHGDGSATQHALIMTNNGEYRFDEVMNEIYLHNEVTYIPNNNDEGVKTAYTKFYKEYSGYTISYSGDPLTLSNLTINKEDLSVSLKSELGITEENGFTVTNLNINAYRSVYRINDNMSEHWQWVDLNDNSTFDMSDAISEEGKYALCFEIVHTYTNNATGEVVNSSGLAYLIIDVE